MRTRSLRAARLGLVAAAAAAVTLAVPAVTASAKSKPKTVPFTCLAVSQLNSVTKGTYGAPVKGAGYVSTAGTCTYRSSTGSTFVIAHAPLGNTKLKKDAQLVSGKDKLITVKGLGHAAIYGSGKIDVLYIQDRTVIYSFRDNSGASTLTQLETIAALVAPG